MGAVRTKTFADLRRRRLQALVIAVVLFLASGAATLALGVLVESRAPFDRAFTAANGAHLVVDYAGTVAPETVAATGRATGVTASAGPWPVTTGALAHPKGGLIIGVELSGRARPDASIDAVTIQAGRWWQSPGEAVLDQDTARLMDRQVGDTIRVSAPPPQATVGKPGPIEPGGPGDEVQPGGDPASGDSVATRPSLTLTVVGIAASVSTPDVAAWMSPADIATLTVGHAPAQQMLYRVDPSASAADLTAASSSITHDLPASAVTSVQTYLDLQVGVDRLADLYVPVLLAFSVFALLAAAFTINNVVGGIVLTSYRDIGVMKAVGFTPRQVSGILVAQILAPALVGAVVGVVLGTLASLPIVASTAESFGLPAASAVSVPVIAVVLLITVATAILAALLPSARAGRLSAVAAIAHGAAPSVRPDGGRLRRFGLRLPFGLPVRLGVAGGVARPSRAAMTLGALVVGVTAATFSIALNGSLLRIKEDLDRSHASPVRAELQGGQWTPAEITDAIAAEPDTGQFVSIADTEVTAPQVGAVPFIGYRNDSGWLGYRLISGRWFSGPGEAVAPTNFFTVSGLHVGDSLTIVRAGQSVVVRLVGEIFDVAREGHDNLLLRGAWDDAASLEPGIQPDRWEMAPAAGIGVRAYVDALQTATNLAVPIDVESESTSDESFLIFLSVVGLMGVVLVTISVGGVFNTVLLETRQRTHELAVLKAIGLTPRQVIEMVVSSIVPIGLLAGLIGVPLGFIAQRAVLDYMGQVAAKTAVPASSFDVVTPPVLAVLILSGLAIGIGGAILPAGRAAKARIAPVLQAE